MGGLNTSLFSNLRHFCPRVSAKFKRKDGRGCEMSELKQLAQIDWWYVAIAITTAFIVVKFIWSSGEWIVEKLGIETKRARERRQQKEAIEAIEKLTKTTAENLDKLQKKHCKDEAEFRQNLNDYMEESRKDRKALHEIQRELKISISVRDEQINALVLANKEMLAEKINEKYKYYISIGGIPEDEYDEFVSMHKAYNGVGGNHHGDAKFEYCKEHLPVIPVETRLKYKEDK
jgi:hypothetical protein